jgi:ABC-type antimicrobial peptide transport system permease subunit
VNGVDRVDDLLAKSLDRPRFLLVLMLVFAGAGLVLAAAGVYGVMSCLVSERMREYGIRLMLGASPLGVARAIMSNAVVSAAIGLLVGLAASALLGRAISAVLFDVDARDVMSYVVVAGVLLSAAAAAAWRPARRGRLADPAALLRND